MRTHDPYETLAASLPNDSCAIAATGPGWICFSARSGVVRQVAPQLPALPRLWLQNPNLFGLPDKLDDIAAADVGRGFVRTTQGNPPRARCKMNAKVREISRLSDIT